MKYKFFRSALTLILLLCVLSAFIVPTYAVNNGSCGPNVSWEFNETNGELCISGNGRMYDYSNTDYVPWRTYTDRITKIIINEGVTTIGRYTFNGCVSAEEIHIPEGVVTIGYCAFDKCSALKKIEIPASVTKIGSAPFYYCSSLTSITVAPENKKYCSDTDGILYNKDKTELIQYPCGKTQLSFSLPFTVETISTGAFAGAKIIKNIVISESVKTIDSMAFKDCLSLKVITIPKSVNLIGEKVFAGCDNISEVYFTGTQQQWDSVTVRNDNESLTNTDFKFESKGPVTLPEESAQNTQESTKSSEATSSASVYPQQKIVQRREIIPMILIGIGVLLIVLIALLIRVIVKKYPES